MDAVRISVALLDTERSNHFSADPEGHYGTGNTRVWINQVNRSPSVSEKKELNAINDTVHNSQDPLDVSKTVESGISPTAMYVKK